MNAVVKELVAKASALPPLERAYLVESLQESLLQVDKDVEALWAAEAETRLDAMSRGDMALEGEPAVLADFRARQK